MTLQPGMASDPRSPAQGKGKEGGKENLEENRQACLDGGAVAFETDNLADELGAAHANELVHGCAVHALRNHDWTVA